VAVHGSVARAVERASERIAPTPAERHRARSVAQLRGAVSGPERYDLEINRLALLRRGQSERVSHEELDHFASFGFCRDLGLAGEIGS
jgi:hypothetical protein